MEVLKEIYFDKWEDFADIFSCYNSEKKEFIFRGHSNYVNQQNEFIKWPLISSFNRQHRRLEAYSFLDYISQHLEENLFKMYYGGYKSDKVQSLMEVSILEKCYFFQHYGISTCFMDFTFDPLIALYFSLSALPGRSGGQYDDNGNPPFYSNENSRDYVSIYKIDLKLLRSILNIKDIEIANFGIADLQKFEIYPSGYNNIHAFVGIDLDPVAKIGSILGNFNLKKQKGCFLFYDNEYFQQNCFEDFLTEFCKEKAVEFGGNIITVYNINYNSLFKKMHSRNADHIPVFRFLKNKQLTGQYLFDDIQGLKYDFNFFHQQ